MRTLCQSIDLLGVVQKLFVRFRIITLMIIMKLLAYNLIVILKKLKLNGNLVSITIINYLTTDCLK